MAQHGVFSMNNVPMLGYAKKDKWVGPFVEYLGGRMATLDEIRSNTTLPMAFSGISKSAALDQAQTHGLDWWYIDTGYLGNIKDKWYFRITKNSHQMIHPVRERDDRRLRRLMIDRTQYPRGSKILVVPPDPKVCSCYHLPDPEQWIEQTVLSIQQYTDRPIEIRRRPASRQVRVFTDTFTAALQNDVNAVVVWTSNCGTESVQHGIPVVSLGPSSVSQVSEPLENIDNLPNLNLDKVEQWLRWLSYNQFTLTEMRRGVAWRWLQQNYERID
jgi:hypothetical protein